MSKEIEIEFKTLLTKEEYVNLCTKFADKRGNLQINYYFDTPRFTLKASEIGLRVRKSDKYVMTLKRKKGYALQEINETISEEVFQQFLKDGIIPVEEIRNELEDVLKGQKVINYMSLSTFRIGFPYKKGNIAIDKCKYVDTVDYELEYEATSYEGGKREFVEIVREFGIVYKKSKPKIRRKRYKSSCCAWTGKCPNNNGRNKIWKSRLSICRNNGLSRRLHYGRGTTY